MSNKLILNSDLHNILEEKYILYSTRGFIPDDPISIPHRFTKKEDIEIAGFLSAIIAWGNRKSIIKSANRIIEYMNEAPHDFILNHEDKDLKSFQKFVHRTFNSDDLLGFIACLKNLYTEGDGLQGAFRSSTDHEESLRQFPVLFFKKEVLARTHKHIAKIDKGSAAKRINMFLRWMVRSEVTGVDFGLWKNISPSELFIPLDVHTARVARSLGLLERKQNDWQAVKELTEKLRQFDPSDPVKYDFALFGMGVSNDYF